MKHTKLRRHMNSAQIIILGFAALVLCGALLLMLPIASQSRTVTPFHETLLTATSASCVTGLIVRSTGAHWSLFGQIVILLLIQIGGLGVVTVALCFVRLSGRKISLFQRSAMQDSISAPQVGGIVRMTSLILRGTFLTEGAGMLLLLPSFCRRFGAKGIWYALFHSISAFCNAGFDLLGTAADPFPSVTSFRTDPLVCVTLALLILIGGIGFLTWEDIATHRHRIGRYRLQSKLILTVSAVLIAFPTLFFFFFEFTDGTVGQRLLDAFFQAVTPRTAGFNTVDLAAMQGASRAIMVVLMLIGGASGSTAGGMKMNTVGVLFANVGAIFRRRSEVEAFGRRIDPATVRQAAAIVTMYLTLFIGGGIAISAIEGLPIGTCLYESASAVATVGLTLGITPTLGVASQLILTVQMYLGRVGGLTLIYAALANPDTTPSRLPQEKVSVG
ncbi:MAG TPA: Trk family potassium uptake protein [Clostridiales bacterium]|nr:Trk family potassium uptake protein [Clostridiales bacterium]